MEIYVENDAEKTKRLDERREEMAEMGTTTQRYQILKFRNNSNP